MDIRPPAPVQALMDRLWASGHAAYVVGGSLRDAALGRAPADWDLASDARPERLIELFPGSSYENRFGTVSVHHEDAVFEITTFRSDHDSADHRRPDHVVFGESIEADLARRDFTINALAWGAGAPADMTKPEVTSRYRGTAAPVPARARLVDPHDGRADIEAGLIRAVGDPAQRFQEDALRMVRAVRFAATLDFVLEPSTLAAIHAWSSLVSRLSGERLAAELEKLLAAPRPSIGLRPMADTGILGVLSPELALQRGVAQNKIEHEDLWDHTLRTVDAVSADRPIVRLAALLHDIGKPSTMAGEHFHGHESVGAELATALLTRLRFPHAVTERVAHLVRQHMFTYDEHWGDTGVRRFIRRVGLDSLGQLFDLREADNIGSGLDRTANGLDDLRRRIDDILARPLVLERGDLAIDGGDLMRELGIVEGPIVGQILDDLLERAIADPAINEPPTLLLLAQAQLVEDG